LSEGSVSTIKQTSDSEMYYRIWLFTYSFSGASYRDIWLLTSDEVCGWKIRYCF